MSALAHYANKLSVFVACKIANCVGGESGTLLLFSYQRIGTCKHTLNIQCKKICKNLLPFWGYVRQPSKETGLFYYKGISN